MDSNLLNSYHNLSVKRKMFKNNIIKNNTLNAAYSDSSVIVTENYYKYIAFLFTALLLIMLFFRFSGTNGIQSGGGKNFCSIGLYKLALVILFVLFYINREKFL